MNAVPKVSIIVAVLNGANVIRRCIESITSQTYPNQELVVIDGGSTDGTAEILREYSGHISWIESGPDKGIYDAWNKALDRATGDWICFLGADDYFANAEGVSALMLEASSKEVDLVCARVAVINGERTVRLVGEPWNWNKMKHHQVVAHPGMLQRRALFERHGKFDARFRIAGDYEFLLRLGSETRAAFLNRAVVCMGGRGLSNTRIGAVLGETRQIQSVHPEIGAVRANCNYVFARAKALVRRVRCGP